MIVDTEAIALERAKNEGLREGLAWLILDMLHEENDIDDMREIADAILRLMRAHALAGKSHT